MRLLQRGKEPEDVSEFLVKKGVPQAQATEFAQALDEKHQDRLRAMSDVHEAEGGSTTPWRGVVNIGIGVLFLFGGLSGDLVLKGTDSRGGLIIVALILITFGVVRLMQAKKKR